MRKILNGILGTASEVSLAEVEKQVGHTLLDGERVEFAYRTVRDLIVFTNARMLTVNVQGVSGKRVDYLTIPYASISHFSVETASTLEIGTDLAIWIIGREQPLKYTFSKTDSIFDVQKVLASYTLGRG